MSLPSSSNNKTGIKRKHDDGEEIFTNEGGDEFLCKIVKVSKSDDKDIIEDEEDSEANTSSLGPLDTCVAEELDSTKEPKSSAYTKIKMLENENSFESEANELILEASDDSQILKTDIATNTEEEYVTDLTKLLRGFQKDYQNLEIEEYKQMLQKFYTQNLRLATRCQKLKAAVEKNQTTTTRILREASKQVNPHQLAFISAQLINNGKAPNKRVWSPQMKNVMVGLFKVSPAAFRFLSKALVLPQEDEINQWIGQGADCDLALEDSSNEDGTTSNISNIEAQAILDEIAFENLMATLL